MPHTRVSIDARKIKDWITFQTVFADAFGFPESDEQNMDAWPDCLMALDVPAGEMSKVHVPPGGVLLLELQHAQDFATRCPVIYSALVECLGFVNYRRVESGQEPVLCLSCPP